MAKYHNPDTGWKGTLIALAVIAGVGYGGWRAYRYFFVGEQRAVITEMRMFGDGIEVGLVFRERPDGDPRDVELVLTSEALNEDVVLDWEGVCEDAFRLELSPEDEPPLGEELRLRISLQEYLRWGARIDRTDAFVEATLRWGGKQQDTARANIFALLR